MNDIVFTLKVVFSMGLATVSSLLGGYDTLLEAMFILMVMDIVCGVIDAGLFNHSKYSKNGLTSDGLVKGAIRKCMLICIVAIAVVLDNILHMDYIRNCAVIYFIATEGLSLLEHMLAMGVPFPKFIKDILETLLEKADAGNSKNEGDGPNA